MKFAINHPLADEISIMDDPNIHYCGDNSAEIAFFNGGEWVTDILPEFSEYADAIAGDTRVYGWVPNGKIIRFLSDYGVQ